MPCMSTHTSSMSVHEMRQAMHAYAASTEESTATYKLAMDTLFADQARQASEMLTAAAITNDNQHNYIAQREAEHKQEIAQHVQRYASLEAELAAEKFDSFKRCAGRSTPAHSATAVAPDIDIFEGDDTDALPLHSIQAFMQEDHLDATSPLPLFPDAQTGSIANN